MASKKAGLLLMAAVLGLARFSLAEPPVVTKPVGDAHRGEALANHWCVSCHLQENSSSGADVAPPFHTVAQLVDKDPDKIRGFLKHPHAPMPPLQLDRGEIEDLIAYFRDVARR